MQIQGLEALCAPYKRGFGKYVLFRVQAIPLQ